MSGESISWRIQYDLPKRRYAYSMGPRLQYEGVFKYMMFHRYIS
jgi:hypothetical protein